jgi:toxin-antitoxin system PIN domain toxin
VILVDANLLVYAHVSSFREHDRAREWLDGKLGGNAQVGLPWESLVAFTRLVSNPRVFERPLSVADAWKQVVRWLSSPTAWIPLPGENHREVLGEVLRTTPGLRANHVPDAHLAALAIEHGLLLCSTDGDFARFGALRWANPIRD